VSAPYYEDNAVTLYHGDCIEVMRSLPDSSVHAVITDPPYGLEFMGNEWDSPWKQSGAVIKDPATERGGFQDGNGGNAYSRSRIEYGRGGSASVGFQEWCEVWATEALRVLKPGGYLLAFGGSRTWHRLSVAIEDAGFEIRDSIAWLYGSGFPKSMDVSKAIDKAAGANREPDTYSGPNNLNAVYGANMGGGQTTAKGDPVTAAAAGWGTALKPAFEPIVVARKPLGQTVAASFIEHGTGALNIDATRVESGADYQNLRVTQGGKSGGGFDVGSGDGSRHTTFEPASGRWPTNVLLDQSQADLLDDQSGILTSGLVKARSERAPTKGGTIYGARARNIVSGDTYGDSGGASRFFPTFHYEAKAPGAERPDQGGVQHPTVKPLDLMRWLVRLVATPGSVILEPFAGSGTTLEACLIEGFNVIGIEREETYLPLILQRIRKPLQQTLFGDGEAAS
jgi:site-specific DNA-methyltransferase (adenine-specific)